MSRPYPVGLVGEAHYQAAVRRCREGDPVRICRQPDNPHDADALVALNRRGETIGYIPRDNWLRRCIVEEGRTATAKIIEIRRAGNGALNVVLEVAASGKGEVEIAPYQAAASTGCALSLALVLIPLAAFASLLT